MSGRKSGESGRRGRVGDEGLDFVTGGILILVGSDFPRRGFVGEIFFPFGKSRTVRTKKETNGVHQTWSFIEERRTRSEQVSREREMTNGENNNE